MPTNQRKEMSKEQEAAEARIKEAITRINAALAETKTVLQPYIERLPNADLAAVRVILAPEVAEEAEDVAKEIKSNDTPSKRAKRS